MNTPSTPPIENLLRQVEPAAGRPPVERWDPPLSGVMDLCIGRDGVWHHQGRPIERQALKRLFAGILRRDADGEYYLLTPVEKWRIQVEDAPFLAVELRVEGAGRGQTLGFVTDVGDEVSAGREHPIEVDYTNDSAEPMPYVHVRGRLRARLTRSVLLELAGLAERQTVGGQDCYCVWSQGECFPLGPAEDA